jgi:tetratricopeptide (TPR) repeat protein
VDREKLRRLIELVESWRIKTRWVLAGIGALAAVLYLNTLGNGFVFDDWPQIVNNPFLRRSDGLAKIFTTGVWQILGPVGISNFYRPLMHALFYFCFHAFGLNPAGYHAISILLHVAISILVFLLVLESSRDRLTAALAALLFAAHPVHTEVVAWISAYPELLASLFSLIAIWLYLKAETTSGRQRLLLQLAIGPVFLLGLLAKEMAAAVPLLLASYEALRRPRALQARATATAAGPGRAAAAAQPAKRRNWRAVGRRVWPAYASLALAGALYIVARVHALGALMPAAARHLPLREQVWTAFAVFWRYFQVQLWPVRLHAFYYLKPSSSPLEPAVAAGIALAAGLLVCAWWLWRRNRSEAWAVPLYILPLAPALLLPSASVGLLMAERYVYLASAGWCWLAAAALAAAIRHPVTVRGPWSVVRGLWSKLGGRKATERRTTDQGPPISDLGSVFFAAVFALILAGYSARTVVRNMAWSDEITFYQQAIADFPGFSRAYLNLGEALMRRERLPEALEATQAAARLDPAAPDPYVNLGLICRQMGDESSAEGHFRQAASLARQQGNRFLLSRALADLAVSYRAAGRLDDSVAASREALEADPLFAGAHNNLAYALLLKNQPDEAIAHLNQATELDPTLDVAWSNLGLAYSMKGEYQKALEFLRRATLMNPGNAETHARAAEAFFALGEVKAGIRELELVLQIDPDNERARKLRQPAERKP